MCRYYGLEPGTINIVFMVFWCVFCYLAYVVYLCGASRLRRGLCVFLVYTVYSIVCIPGDRWIHITYVSCVLVHGGRERRFLQTPSWSAIAPCDRGTCAK